ncbi:MAG: ABC transporter permease subunit [wastewater metagenome]|nr:ABC transporter permease subunit [Candidatus Loosdrechtia aerotolerans]
MTGSWIPFVYNRLPELWLRIGEHILLTGISTSLAILIGIPLGILANQVRGLRGILLSTVGVLQTIPSLAMLAILLALLQKIGVVPAITALTLYALLPIVRNTYTGLEAIPPEMAEAALGIGMTPGQQLWLVKLPLALPMIIAGIRTAVVVNVGIATLSAFIGAGGLGQFINRGLALSNTRLILLGAVPAGILALFVDFSIATAGWGLHPARKTEYGLRKTILRITALSLPFTLFILGVIAYSTGLTKTSVTVAGESSVPQAIVRIGTKNFTEQFILGEMMAQLIEARTGLSVERKFNLGGTMICHGSLISGGIDIYPEYTGTGLTAILQKKMVSDPDSVLPIVREAYQERFQVKWLFPFGFNNTYAITVRKMDANQHNWHTISDLASAASGLRAGFTGEFAERPDGYPGIIREYGFQFGSIQDLDPAILYEAIARNQVDVICAFATDGRITAYQLQPLKDNRNVFPPYHCAPVIREKTLKKYPEISDALQPLAGILDNETMQRLNYEVDERKRMPKKVAEEFLRKHVLLDH